ncbi:MAG: lysine biosynthesis protein LysW [Phycisphaeraceae bacterium]|nr:lysine biosynthesis protein LysW [Phycisphaeraceae bacterium]
MNTTSLEQPTSADATRHALDCPECAAAITLVRPPLLGEVVRCGECAVELEVVSTDPLRVEVAPQVEEDWGE